RLPAWIPPRRTLGGFYVQRALGHGTGGSVFVVTRAEERHDPNAERFALKVPEYGADAARALSEADFMRLFRQEASALLELPEHPNLARFVTFDAGAKPKPILVMELVEGPGTDQVIAARAVTTTRALGILAGVLAGLGAMHEKGVGHLDLKPSNVILRGGGGLVEERAVLVDFGLAGRHLRPGCGTGPYVAPEIWVADARTPGATPPAADVYAFGCFAFELLTGADLFDAPNEVALIAAHLAHDGLPPPIKAMAGDAALQPLAMLLYACLRRRPEARIAVPELRKELAAVSRGIVARPWPLRSP
ncbi:MAG TPA: serine/threonine-protein kinase, partial [Minicystis sp.]|nr:serine/threonine-protein kinase [Minicystis sp.]